MSVRKSVLDKAIRTVMRNQRYGTVENNFDNIAKLWSAYTGTTITPVDVAAMMALMKIARTKANPAYLDSWIDLAGYADCGAEAARAGKKRMAM